MRRALAIGLAAAVLASLAAASGALAACPQATLADVEDEVMCPVCGVPLGLAEAPQAERERALIQSHIDKCSSKREIKRALAAEYGPSVLALPEDDGFNLAAYLVPALALLAGGGGIALAMARWQRGHRRNAGNHAELGEVPALDPADLARLDAELEGRDR